MNESWLGNFHASFDREGSVVLTLDLREGGLHSRRVIKMSKTAAWDLRQRMGCVLEEME